MSQQSSPNVFSSLSVPTDTVVSGDLSVAFPLSPQQPRQVVIHMEHRLYNNASTSTPAQVDQADPLAFQVPDLFVSYSMVTGYTQYIPLCGPPLGILTIGLKSMDFITASVFLRAACTDTPMVLVPHGQQHDSVSLDKPTLVAVATLDPERKTVILICFKLVLQELYTTANEYIQATALLDLDETMYQMDGNLNSRHRGAWVPDCKVSGMLMIRGKNHEAVPFSHEAMIRPGAYEFLLRLQQAGIKATAVTAGDPAFAGELVTKCNELNWGCKDPSAPRVEISYVQSVRASARDVLLKSFENSLPFVKTMREAGKTPPVWAVDNKPDAWAWCDRSHVFGCTDFTPYNMNPHELPEIAARIVRAAEAYRAALAAAAPSAPVVAVAPLAEAPSAPVLAAAPIAPEPAAAPIAATVAAYPCDQCGDSPTNRSEWGA
jgi:hypothetical protein